MSKISVKIRWDLVSDDNEIKKAIFCGSARSRISAAEWNLKQDEKYLRYAKKCSSPEIMQIALANVARAKSCLEEVKLRNAA